MANGTVFGGTVFGGTVVGGTVVGGAVIGAMADAAAGVGVDAAAGATVAGVTVEAEAADAAAGMTVEAEAGATTVVEGLLAASFDEHADASSVRTHNAAPATQTGEGNDRRFIRPLSRPHASCVQRASVRLAKLRRVTPPSS